MASRSKRRGASRPNLSAETSNSVADEFKKLNSDELNAVMKEECNRLASFGGHWPHHGSLAKEKVAEAGLYYNGPGDKVTCPFCKVFIECWDPFDNPMDEHTNLSHTTCPFIQDPTTSGNIAFNDDDSMDTCPPPTAPPQRRHGEKRTRSCSPPDPLDPSLDAAPPEPSEKAHQPVAPELQEPMKRLQSFSAWPRDHVKRPDELFPAGFYYTGIADKVRCYSCGGELNRWNAYDIPWVEHAKFHPECEFLKVKKTKFFIDQVNESSNVVTTKQDLREYAQRRGFDDFDIEQVLSRADPYESEEDMFSAILALENDDYNREMAMADDSDEAEGKACLFS